MRLEADDYGDEERESYWYEPPRPEARRETVRDVARAACKTILDRLGPAPLVAGAGGAYREHLENPPPGPGDVPCACVACVRFAELKATTPYEAALAQTLKELRR